MFNLMSTFKDMNIIVVVTMLLLAKRIIDIILDDEVRARRRILGWALGSLPVLG